MNIDELQQKFNEMRRKKWRLAGRSERVEICGFRVGISGMGLISVQIETAPYTVYIDADSLSTVAGVGPSPFIEEVSPYADWPVDAKIRVWNLPDGEKETRHFAGVGKDGHPRAWVNGDTSHTSGISISWRHAELAEDGE